jgi:hypothetical protein
MTFVLFIWIAVFLVGLYQIAVPYKPLPPHSAEFLEWQATMDYHIANSSSEDCG